MKTSFSVVPDTNVVIASEKSTSTSGPNREFFDRWRNDEFEILYSDDMLLEYIEKMRERDISEEIIKKLIRAMLELGRHISIVFYHLPLYPSDPDDIAFLLCAENGNATHIVSYDPHLKETEYFYSFRVCTTLEFLFDLREKLS
ncbi:PIN domain-containing protein [Candidatus Thiosymbion oneisti]|uniref:PIN domain-containing protein n=1 Tax=Candidatus Thiosymbion oneisti TaxID=589554 RepID=UPI00105B4B05|nr:PIN domain-containing protein [Candidatus Thiosymbion oneisti]